MAHAAAINEAVELAKKYSMKNDSGFINGILNSYMGELNADKQ
ncbi:MAG: transcription antitermination factor NusB [Oscillospiraceae bacterium]